MDAYDEMIQRIDKALDSIRPFLNNDGGDVRIVEVTPEMVAKVMLIGACGTCPFNVMTLKNGIEHAIKRDVPEIVEVVAIQDEELLL